MNVVVIFLLTVFSEITALDDVTENKNNTVKEQLVGLGCQSVVV